MFCCYLRAHLFYQHNFLAGLVFFFFLFFFFLVLFAVDSVFFVKILRRWFFLFSPRAVFFQSTLLYMPSIENESVPFLKLPHFRVQANGSSPVFICLDVSSIAWQGPTTQHPYHLVPPSPWPFATSLAVFGFTTSFVNYLHYSHQFFLLLFCFSVLLGCLFIWWRDISFESDVINAHTLCVRRGLSIGFKLFIVSEAMLFFSFFWAYLHAALSPTIAIGGVWPPPGIISYYPAI